MIQSSECSCDFPVKEVYIAPLGRIEICFAEPKNSVAPVSLTMQNVATDACAKCDNRNGHRIPIV